MEKDKQNYWDKVTEDTTIEWLRRRNLLSVRLSNILVRGAIYKGYGNTEYKPIKTVKELLEIDECDLSIYKNMGRKTLEEVEQFKQKFLRKKQSYQITEQGQADWLDGYKLGFKEGVVAVQTQLKEVNLEFQLVGNKYSQADIKAAVNGFYKAFMQKLDEICKELVDE